MPTRIATSACVWPEKQASCADEQKGVDGPGTCIDSISHSIPAVCSATCIDMIVKNAKGGDAI